ncbi:Crp/Fnr family transcriptional regulator [Yunchengibacter salinarum]|uniref:Crp/Fnr family transcriptional regulator n=1 Tax=Yunchengibacter salinarum TaxID=3133399 RepID=UPI0035B5B0C7
MLKASPDIQTWFQQEGDPVTFPRGSLIKAGHQPADPFLLVQSGWLLMYDDLPEKGPSIAQFYTTQELAPGLSGLFLHDPSEIRARTDCAAIAVSADRIREKINEDQTFRDDLLTLMASKLLVARRRWSVMGHLNAREAVMILLAEISVRTGNGHDTLNGGRRLVPHTIEMPLTNAEIGQVVGLSESHVGRVMRSLDEDGHTRQDGQTIHILNWTETIQALHLPRLYQGTLSPPAMLNSHAPQQPQP